MVTIRQLLGQIAKQQIILQNTTFERFDNIQRSMQTSPKPEFISSLSVLNVAQ